MENPNQPDQPTPIPQTPTSPSNLTHDQKVELLKMLDAKKAAERDRFIEDYDPSLVQTEFLCSTAKLRIITGANRAGKSDIGGLDTLIRSTGIIPDRIKDRFPMDKIRVNGNEQDRFYLSSALDFNASCNVSQAKIFRMCPRKSYKDFNKEHRKLFLKTNNTILFKSQESGREKYQGISCLHIWLDEEHQEDVYDECYMRTVDCAGTMSFSFTPIEGLTWSYQKLYKKAKYYITSTNTHGIPEEVGMVHSLEDIAKLKERKLVIIPNTSEDADEDICVFQMTVYDNKHLPDAEIQRNERRWQHDTANYNARVLGQFTKISTRNVFDSHSLIIAKSKAATKFKRGSIINGQFKENLRGNLVIFDPKIKSDGGSYVIGADIAEGLEDGDYSCAQILNRRTCEQVGIWHGHCPPDEFGRILYDIGMFFNKAYLAPERNFHGYGVVNSLRDLKYPRLYYDRDKAQEVIKKQVAGHKTYGWDTNSHTKTIMIQTLAAFIRNKHIKINDINTIDELMSYAYDESKEGKTGAMRGCHDDRVIALAIALQLYENTPITSLISNDSSHYGDIRVNKRMGY